MPCYTRNFYVLFSINGVWCMFKFLQEKYIIYRRVLRTERTILILFESISTARNAKPLFLEFIKEFISYRAKHYTRRWSILSHLPEKLLEMTFLDYRCSATVPSYSRVEEGRVILGSGITYLLVKADSCILHKLQSDKYLTLI